MSIKSDRWIRRMAREHGMIEPFADSQVREGVISYGVSSYGYDMRVAPEFKIFTNVLVGGGGPEAFRCQILRRVRGTGLHRAAQLLRAGPVGGVFPDPPQRPDDLRGEEHVRPLRHHHERHPFRAGVGRLRNPRDLEHHALPARIYANEGIAQVLFFEADEGDECEQSYADKRGKYQSQTGITLPKL